MEKRTWPVNLKLLNAFTATGPHLQVCTVIMNEISDLITTKHEVCI